MGVFRNEQYPFNRWARLSFCVDTEVLIPCMYTVCVTRATPGRVNSLTQVYNLSLVKAAT